MIRRSGFRKRAAGLLAGTLAASVMLTGCADAGSITSDTAATAVPADTAGTASAAAEDGAGSASASADGSASAAAGTDTAASGGAAERGSGSTEENDGSNADAASSGSTVESNAGAAAASSGQAADGTEKGQAASGGASSDSGSEPLIADSGDAYLLPSLEEMNAVLLRNPLSASREYKGEKIAVYGTVSDIDADGTYLLLTPVEPDEDSGYSLIGEAGPDTAEGNSSGSGNDGNSESDVDGADGGSSAAGANAVLGAEADRNSAEGDAFDTGTGSEETDAGENDVMKDITCLLATDELVDTAAGLEIGDQVTACGEVTGVDGETGYTVTLDYLDSGDEPGRMTASDYEDYETLLLSDDVEMDIPLAWCSEGMTIELVEGDNGRTIRMRHENSKGSGDYVVWISVTDLGEEAGDLEDRTAEMQAVLGDAADGVSFGFDTVYEMERAVADFASEEGESYPGRTQAAFFAEEDSDLLYSLTVQTLSGDAGDETDNAAYFQNAAESARRVGTKHWSTRDYTGWHRETLGGYSLMVKDEWAVLDRDALGSGTDSHIEFVIGMTEDGTSSDDSPRIIVLNHDGDAGSGSNRTGSGSTAGSGNSEGMSRQQTMETLLATDKDEFVKEIKSSLSSSGIDADSIGFDHVNGALRIKCGLEGESELKREDLVIYGDTEYDFAFFASTDEYAEPQGQFTKCVRSFNLPEAGVMREAEAASDKTE